MYYGYVRVSSKEQNIARQVEALELLGVDRKRIYIDMQSGKNFNRPAYQKLLRKVKSGDVIVIKSIDRLGRNYDEILEQWRVITKLKQVDIYVLDFSLLDTRKKDNDLMGTFIADLVFADSFVCGADRARVHSLETGGRDSSGSKTGCKIRQKKA